MTAPSEPSTCREWRDACFDSEAAFGPGSSPGAGHGSECAACADWWGRQCRLVAAFRDLQRSAAPAALDQRLGSEQLAAARTRAVLEHLSVLHAPAVLDRLVGEEISGQPGTTVGRFATDLARLQAPAALERALADSAAIADEPAAAAREFRTSIPGGLRRRWIGAAGALAAGLLALVVLRAGSDEPNYRFEVVELDAAQLREQSPLGFRFADAVSGGAVAVRAALGESPAGGGRK
ncbi:MAG: hypothetical protein FJ299_05580 [Planctomycetes bacterium]|nr:hypothetical protein [Planctomycetota bacterium]